MTTRGRQALEEAINMDRPRWTAADGNGPEGHNYSSYLLFNPSMAAIASLKDITINQLEDNEVADRLPKRVKLSDSAIGLIITIGVPGTKCTSWYPLTFNSAGYIIAQPTHNHFGHAYTINGVIASFGKETTSQYPLCGTRGYTQGHSLTSIMRPHSGGRKKPRIAQKSSSGAAQQTSSGASSPVPKELLTPSVAPSMSAIKKGKRPRSLSPEQSMTADTFAHTFAQPDTTTGLTELKQDFVALMGITERLDSTILSQAEALAEARDLFKIFLPVLEAIAAKDKPAFTALKPDIEANIGSYKARVASLREAYKVTVQRRDNAEADMESIHPEGSLWTFQHQGPDHDPPEALRVFQEDSTTADASAWQREFHQGKTVQELKEDLPKDDMELTL